MKRPTSNVTRAGRVSYGIIAWALGMPTIVVIIALLWGGCNQW